MAVVFMAVVHAQDSASPSAANSSGSSTSMVGNTVGKKALPASDRVVLKVGTMQVTEAEFESRIGDIEGQGGSDSDKEGPTNKERRRLGDDYASVLMLSQRAVADHLDSSPEISRKLAIARIQILSDAAFANLMDQAKPTSGEISQYYNSHLSDYDELQIRRLFIWKSGADSKNRKGLTPEAARARADAILQASAAGRDTTQLIKAFQGSDEGLLDSAPLTFPRGELPPAIEKVAFVMNEGKWAQAQDTRDSTMLVLLVKRDHQQLGEVSSLIEKRVQTQKMQMMLDDLKKNAGIWMDEKYFADAAAPEHGTSRNSNALSKHQESTGETNERKQ